MDAQLTFFRTPAARFLGGFNVRRNIPLISSGKLFLSSYVGAGYANIGESRLSVDSWNGIINQELTRMIGIFVRGGARLALLYPQEKAVLNYYDFLVYSYSIKTIFLQKRSAACPLPGNAEIIFSKN